MRKFMQIGLISLLCFISSAALAYEQFTQSVQIVNLLGNRKLADPGMTPTTIIIKYFNGNAYPCWTTTLSYEKDATIHAGPTQGCRQNVSLVTVTPLTVAAKLTTYRGSQSVSLEPQKFAHQLIVTEAASPIFNASNGLVAMPGEVKVDMQSQFK